MIGRKLEQKDPKEISERGGKDQAERASKGQDPTESFRQGQM